MHPALRGQVEEALLTTGLDPKFLKLEVTESTVIERSETRWRPSEMKALGLSLSMDDFGTGYSSLSYLHQFPFERLKIDRSFVDTMDHDPKSEAIVRTILLLGKNLKMEVVAEGIEKHSTTQSAAFAELQFRPGLPLFTAAPRATAEAFLLHRGGDDRSPIVYDPADLVEVSEIQ
jgi:EAL domain-containing protein (putative c-di-GMP-specific phosphodiesterase class I)